MSPIAKAPAAIRVFIDNKAFSTRDFDQEASALLRLAGRDPKTFDLFLVAKNGVEEKIRDGQIVNLKDDERFVTRQHIRFTIDGEPFDTHDEDQTAAALLRLAGVDPAGYDLARILQTGATESFSDDTIVTLTDGDEFVTTKHVGGVA
ncbi:multiubiquitin domain-containing protein [Clavibacter nebraskensis]|uniref:multiubiquitin domain-containing protein n=1 Tax=Clavibacter nebraskensis TaxID=31963 RepID=UPI003F874E30